MFIRQEYTSQPSTVMICNTFGNQRQGLLWWSGISPTLVGTVADHQRSLPAAWIECPFKMGRLLTSFCCSRKSEADTNHSYSRHTAQRWIWYAGNYKPPLGCMTGKPCAFDKRFNTLIITDHQQHPYLVGNTSHRTQWLDLAYPLACWKHKPWTIFLCHRTQWLDLAYPLACWKHKPSGRLNPTTGLGWHNDELPRRWEWWSCPSVGSKQPRRWELGSKVDLLLTTEYKSNGFTCIRPTVHLICGHSLATVGLYAGDTVCFVLSRNPSVHRPNTVCMQVIPCVLYAGDTVCLGVSMLK